MEHRGEVSESVSTSDSVEVKIRRGPESWNYIYVALGFAISIEGSVVQMIDSIKAPLNILLFVVAAVISVWFFFFNGWFQNKLIGWKAAYEGRSR